MGNVMFATVYTKNNMCATPHPPQSCRIERDSFDQHWLTTAYVLKISSTSSLSHLEILLSEETRMHLKRIAAELANLQRDTAETGLMRPIEAGDTLDWVAQIGGPQESPYAQGRFDIEITFEENYPRSPPRITFLTPLFHPNVSESGVIRLAEFDTSQWSPAITMRTLLISLQAMLSDPNPLQNCILNEEAAALYLHNPEEFRKRAREWIETLAV